MPASCQHAKHVPALSACKACPCLVSMQSMSPPCQHAKHMHMHPICQSAVHITAALLSTHLYHSTVKHTHEHSPYLRVIRDMSAMYRLLLIGCPSLATTALLSTSVSRTTPRSEFDCWTACTPAAIAVLSSGLGTWLGNHPSGSRNWLPEQKQKLEVGVGN